MKKLALLLSTIFALATISQAQVQQMQFGIKSITPMLVQTPAFSYSPPIPQSRPDTRKWLVIQTQFSANAVDKTATTDELQFNYYVALTDGKTMFTGQVNHVNIPVGSQLYSMMLMSPDALAKISAITKRPFAVSDIGNIYVQITKPGVSAPLAAMVMKQIGTSGWWTQMSQTPGFLVDQSATPFAPIALQNFVAIKPTNSR